MTSETEMSPKVRRLASIRRSWEVSSWVSRSLSSMTSSRLSRMVESLRRPRTACANRAAISLRRWRPCGMAAARASAGSMWVERALPEIGPGWSESAGMGVSLGRLAPRRIGTRAIRIVDPELFQQRDFQGFHPFRLVRVLVIVAEQMQDAMDAEMGRVPGYALALAPCFLGHDAKGQSDITY